MAPSSILPQFLSVLGRKIDSAEAIKASNLIKPISPINREAIPSDWIQDKLNSVNSTKSKQILGSITYLGWAIKPLIFMIGCLMLRIAESIDNSLANLNKQYDQLVKLQASLATCGDPASVPQ